MIDCDCDPDRVDKAYCNLVQTGQDVSTLRYIAHEYGRDAPEDVRQFEDDTYTVAHHIEHAEEHVGDMPRRLAAVQSEAAMALEDPEFRREAFRIFRQLKKIRRLFEVIDPALVAPPPGKWWNNFSEWLWYWFCPRLKNSEPLNQVLLSEWHLEGIDIRANQGYHPTRKDVDRFRKPLDEGMEGMTAELERVESELQALWGNVYDIGRSFERVSFNRHLGYGNILETMRQLRHNSCLLIEAAHY